MTPSSPRDAAGSLGVKICGLRHAADARDADEAGADYLGVVLSEGFGRSVTPEAGVEILRGVGAQRVAVLVDETPADAVAHAVRLGAAVIQLHGTETPEDVGALGRAGPWRIWKAVRLRTLDELNEAVDRYGHVVDGLLVEGWKEGVVGGGGVRAVPEVVSEVRRVLPGDVAFVLAGGLTPDSVADAVARFGPDVVDVSSGVEIQPGRKDPGAMRRFIREARSASQTPVQPRSG